MSATESNSKIEINPSLRVNDTSEHSDPSVNTHQLPDDHPIFLHQEAQEFYRGRQPPFLLRKHSENRRRCVIPTKDGLRPRFPTTVEIFARPWDKNFMFWTIDRDQKRYIIKSFHGQNGAQYLTWAGPASADHFKQHPLALSEFSSKHLPHRLSATAVEATESESSSNFSQDEEGGVSDQSGNRGRPTETSGSSFHADHGDNAGAEQTRRGNLLKKGQTPMRHSELPPEIPHISSQSQEGPRKRRRTDISTREIHRLLRITSPSPRPRNVQSDGQPASTILNQESSSAAQQQASSSSTGHFTNLFVQPAPTPAILDDKKRDRTTLIVRIAPSSEYIPLKLSECTTISDFFTKTIGVWHLSEQDVAKVKVCFIWKAARDPMRVMVMNRNQNGCFVYLMEEIDDAPAWDEEKAKCLVDVDIVMKE